MVLSPEDGKTLSKLLAMDNTSDDYKQKYDAFISSLSDDDREIVKKILKPPNPVKTAKQSITDSIQRVTWVEGLGWQVTFKDNKMYVSDDSFLVNGMGFRNWYIRTYNRLPEFDNMKWKDFLAWLLSISERVDGIDTDQDENRSILMQIAAFIKSNVNVDVNSKDLKKRNPRNTVYVDDNFYYIYNRVVKQMYDEFNWSDKKASLNLREYIVPPSRNIRFGDQVNRFWRFSKRKIDEFIRKTDMNNDTLDGNGDE